MNQLKSTLVTSVIHQETSKWTDKDSSVTCVGAPRLNMDHAGSSSGKELQLVSCRQVAQWWSSRRCTSVFRWVLEPQSAGNLFWEGQNWVPEYSTHQRGDWCFDSQSKRNNCQHMLLSRDGQLCSLPYSTCLQIQSHCPSWVWSGAGNRDSGRHTQSWTLGCLQVSSGSFTSAVAHFTGATLTSSIYSTFVNVLVSTESRQEEDCPRQPGLDQGCPYWWDTCPRFVKGYGGTHPHCLDWSGRCRCCFLAAISNGKVS